MSKIYMKVVIKCGGCPHVKASMSGLAVNRWMCWAVDPAREVYLLEIPEWCPLEDQAIGGVIVKAKEAKVAYRKAKGNAFRWTFGDRWKITMLGRLSWMIPIKGNEKVMYKVTRGRNTKFTGRFVVYRFGRSYSLLKYNKPENSWWVRRIRDRVRFVDDALAVGRFYWGGIFLGWFIMERVDSAPEEV